MSVLATLQRSIESLHDIETELQVEHYAIDEDALEEIIGARSGIPEQLLIREVDGEMELALYVDAAILRNLEDDPPHTQLHEGNLEPFCVALEGVSHFVFVAYRAQLGRPVTPLEMEIQAEVDKFVQSWLLLHDQGRAWDRTAEHLLHRLFEAYEVREEVPADEVDRYRTATRAARGYCRGLLDRFGRELHPARAAAHVVRDVRAYYRSGLSDKLRAA